MQGPQIWSPGWEDPLEKEMATHSDILAWEIPWTEGTGGLQSMGSQTVEQDLAIKKQHTISLSLIQSLGMRKNWKLPSIPFSFFSVQYNCAWWRWMRCRSDHRGDSGPEERNTPVAVCCPRNAAVNTLMGRLWHSPSRGHFFCPLLLTWVRRQLRHHRILPYKIPFCWDDATEPGHQPSAFEF